MTKRIYITEQEHSKLIRASTEHGPIATSFGANGVWLSREEGGDIVSGWALRLLAEWRGYTVNEGAGI